MPSLSFLQPGYNGSIEGETHTARQERNRDRHSCIDAKLCLETIDFDLVPRAGAQFARRIWMKENSRGTDVGVQQFRSGDSNATIIQVRDGYSQPLIFAWVKGFRGIRLDRNRRVQCQVYSQSLPVLISGSPVI